MVQLRPIQQDCLDFALGAQKFMCETLESPPQFKWNQERDTQGIQCGLRAAKALEIACQTNECDRDLIVRLDDVYLALKGVCGGHFVDWLESRVEGQFGSVRDKYWYADGDNERYELDITPVMLAIKSLDNTLKMLQETDGRSITPGEKHSLLRRVRKLEELLSSTPYRATYPQESKEALWMDEGKFDPLSK